jgi:hypothetical protein
VTLNLPTEPVCWSWPVPEDLNDLAEAAVARLSREAAAAVLYSNEAHAATALETWHEGRCAICGWNREELVTDHDHETGLIRGLLCRSCNTREGIRGDGVFAAYRSRNPALILGVRARYYDPYTGEYAKPRPSRQFDRWTDNPVVGL